MGSLDRTQYGRTTVIGAISLGALSLRNAWRRLSSSIWSALAKTCAVQGRNPTRERCSRPSPHLSADQEAMEILGLEKLSANTLRDSELWIHVQESQLRSPVSTCVPVSRTCGIGCERQNTEPAASKKRRDPGPRRQGLISARENSSPRHVTHLFQLLLTEQMSPSFLNVDRFVI